MLVRVTDASNKMKRRILQIYTHTPQIEQTGNSHSVKVVFSTFLRKPQAVLFPWYLRSFVLLCFISMCVICWFWICFVLFFHCVCYLHEF